MCEIVFDGGEIAGAELWVAGACIEECGSGRDEMELAEDVIELDCFFFFLVLIEC